MIQRREALRPDGVPVSTRIDVQMSPFRQIEELHRLHHESLVRSAFWIVGDMHEAEELVQEAYIRLAEAIDQLDDPAKAKQYLHRIVLNLSRSQVRRLTVGAAKLRLLANRTDRDPESLAHAQALRDTGLGAELARLPRRQRECLVLRYEADLTVPQIAEVLGVAEGSVKSHLHRGLGRLRDRLPKGSAQ
jgi:RNA polymerase sigma-70 factor (sigma-E family)